MFIATRKFQGRKQDKFIPVPNTLKTAESRGMPTLGQDKKDRANEPAKSEMISWSIHEKIRVFDFAVKVFLSMNYAGRPGCGHARCNYCRMAGHFQQGGKEKVEANILSYLVDHPDARDTLEGILLWWLLTGMLERNKSIVAEVLEGLVLKGLVFKQKRGESLPEYYCINKDRQEDIEKEIAAGG